MKKLKVSWDPKIPEMAYFYKTEMNKPDKIYTDQKVEGYWFSEEEPDYPIPVQNILTDVEAEEICQLILAKEDNAKLNRYLGYSKSRITYELLGSVEYELDDWKWTGDLARHYVKKYKVKPTDEFLTFIGYPNDNKTKASVQIKYNHWKRAMTNMVDEISKEIDKEILTSILLISDEPDINGKVYTKEAIEHAVENFNKDNLGELSHNSKSEMEEFKNVKD